MLTKINDQLTYVGKLWQENPGRCILVIVLALAIIGLGIYKSQSGTSVTVVLTLPSAPASHGGEASKRVLPSEPPSSQPPGPPVLMPSQPTASTRREPALTVQVLTPSSQGVSNRIEAEGNAPTRSESKVALEKGAEVTSATVARQPPSPSSNESGHVDRVSTDNEVSSKPNSNVDARRSDVPEQVIRPSASDSVQEKVQNEPSDTISSSFDGDWYNAEYRYGFRIHGNEGIATISNSPKFAPGDLIVRLRATSKYTFEGEQVFKDGSWYEVTGERTTRDTLVMHHQVGPGLTWTMRLRDSADEVDKAETAPQKTSGFTGSDIAQTLGANLENYRFGALTPHLRRLTRKITGAEAAQIMNGMGTHSPKAAAAIAEHIEDDINARDLIQILGRSVENYRLGTLAPIVTHAKAGISGQDASQIMNGMGTPRSSSRSAAGR